VVAQSEGAGRRGVFGLLLLGAGVALALLVASALFFAWGFTRPLVDELEEEERVTEGEPEGRARP
jgi:hypothetical protein